MRDRIAVRGLRGHGHHGVFDSERREGQVFVVGAVLRLDTTPAAASDDVDDTVHYGLLADRLVAIVTGEPVDLIETLAERLARSEEHTSELQSRFDLVCRLLLEKKNASIESYGDYNSG